MMHKQRIAIGIAAGVGALATFMPWVNAPFLGSVPGSAGDGWFTFGFFVVAGCLAMVGAREQSMPRPLALGVMGLGALASIFALWKIVDIKGSLAEAQSGNVFAEAMSKSVSIGFGLYLVVLAGIALVGVTLALREERRQEVAVS